MPVATDTLSQAPLVSAGLVQESIALTNLYAPPLMPPTADHDMYARLRIPKASDNLAIQNAFRRLVLELHPDRNPSKDTKAFYQLCEAYEVLSNPLTRGVYDLFGKEGLDLGIPSEEGKIEFKGYVYHGDPHLTFRNFFGSDNLFHELFKSRMYVPESGIQHMGLRALQPLPIQHPPIRVPLSVTLAEVYRGTQRKVPWTRQVLRSAHTDTLTTVTEHLRLVLEPGTPAGTQLVFPRLGNEAPNTLPSDLVFCVELAPHPHFEIVDLHHLRFRHTLPLEDALLGSTVTLTTLDGRTLAIPVPEIVYPGYVKHIPNEGFPFVQSDGTKAIGDLLIEFEIKFPKYLSLKQKEWIKKGMSAEQKKGPLIGSSTTNQTRKPTTS